MFFPDWLTLRKEHRIVGNLIGTLSVLPRQDTMLGLPMMLMPEEVRLLLDQKLAQVVKYDILKQIPTLEMLKEFEDFRQQSYLDQVCNIF
jgi:tRNA-splicing endonuclease subunit Sen34